MCTVSWIQRDGGYELLCNRDEKHTRSVAQGPRESLRGGVRVLAPVDTDFGGAWIAANELGLSLALLNAYEAPARPRLDPISRGLLVLELSGCRSVRDVRERLFGIELDAFRPFSLLALEPDSAAVIFDWDTWCLSEDREALRRLPLTSSSFEPARVTSIRRETFQRELGQPSNPESLFSFHKSHTNGPSAFSTCMHRGDAATVSFSWIKVNRLAVEFSYTAGAPCQQAPHYVKLVARR